jgi:hypothetical protein
MKRKSRLFAFAFALFGVLGNSDAFAVQYGNCHWDGTDPICRGKCSDGFVQVKIKGCLSGHKAYCCEVLGSTTSDGPGQPYVPASPQPAALCPSGLVWRERFDGDTVCVLPGERDANRRRRGLPASAAASACPSGLVWREQFDGDTVCVTPLERDTNRRRRGLPVN